MGERSRLIAAHENEKSASKLGQRHENLTHKSELNALPLPHAPHHLTPKASMGALSLYPPSPYHFYLRAATTFTACQFLPCSPSRKLQVERRINDSKCRGNPGSLPPLLSSLSLSSLCSPSIFAISFCALLCNCFKLISQMRNF